MGRKRGYYMIVKPVYLDGAFANINDMPYDERIKSATRAVESASETFGDGRYLLLKVGPNGKSAEIVEEFGVHSKAEVVKRDE